MAPAKGTKRVATQVAHKAEKKPKVDPMIVGVNEAINMAVLPEACRALLLAVAPTCLLIPADQRHEHEKLVVKMIGEVVDGVVAEMHTALDADAAKIKEAETTKDSHESTVSAATASLAAKAEDVSAKESALGGISKTVLDAKTNVDDAQSAQSKGNADIDTAEKDKKMIEDALSAHVNALKEEVEWETAKAQKNLDALLPLTKLLAFEESLITALLTSCVKKPSDRTDFDVMVFNQLETNMKNRVVELTETLSNAGPASAEFAAKVVAMQKLLDDANADHQHAVTELSAAKVAHSEAASALQAAEAAYVASSSEHARLIGVRDKKVLEMDCFKNHNMLLFTTLRDKIADKAEPIAEGTTVQDIAMAGV